MTHGGLGVDVAATFREILDTDPMLATAIAAIRTLILVLEKCPARTLQVNLQGPGTVFTTLNLLRNL